MSKTPRELIQEYYDQRPDFVALWEEEKKTWNKKDQPTTTPATTTMPVQPKEEETHENITDKVAKESSDSTASSHGLHQTSDKAKATVEDHTATPGIAMSSNLGEPVSKDELKKRSEELNKK